MEQTSPLVEALTEREQEILRAIADDLSNQEIADSLHLALTTVKWYNTQIYGKLGAKNRHEAIRQARLLGLLDGEHHTLPDVPHNLPPQTTAFVGRYEELSELDSLLNDAHIRLVTILAPGGMGKTRLALQLAQQQLSQFADGVFFIGLAPLPVHSMIQAAIADVFELFSYDDTVELKQGVLNYLQSKEVLLVLDNFEHLLEGAGIISDLLQAAPRLKILVTSRERLNLRGETVYTLGGMSFPPLDGDYIPEYDSIRLFVNGARRVRPDYELNEQDLEYVIEICQLVDGMPLGIELASGWMDVLSAEKIAREIRSNIDILETDMRDIPERHRSIRATFNRSWESLPPDEQLTMMRLSVFRGGFRQEAAEEVAATNIRHLKRLVNKSLLYVDAFGRYSIHELLRQYCQEKLQRAGEYEATLDRHGAYYADYLAQRHYKLSTFEGLIYQETGAEYDNIIMTWDHLIASKQYELLEKMTRPVWQYLTVRRSTTEIHSLFERAAEAIEPQMHDYPRGIEIYGKLMFHVVNSYWGFVERAEIERQIRDVIALLESTGESEILAHFYLELAGTLDWSETYKGAVLELFEKARNYFQMSDSYAEQTALLYWLAEFYYRIDEKEQSWGILRQAERLKDEHNLAAYLRIAIQYSAVEMYIDAGMYAEAEKHLEESLFIFERAEWVYGIAQVRRMKMQIALAHDDRSEAERHCAAIIRWHQTHARDWQMLGALWGAYVRFFLMQIEEDERAVEILSFVIDHPVTVMSSVEGATRCLEELRERMDEDAFEAAFERGKHLELKQAVADAMAFLTTN